MPKVETLVDFTVVYASKKRSTWDFLCGDMRKAQVVVKTYSIPPDLKNRSFEDEREYRAKFQEFINKIWLKKQAIFSELKF